jgi:hypothetical protein
MKTNDLKSTVAALAAVAVLSTTVFAGPGPHNQDNVARPPQAKPTVVAVQAAKAPATGFKPTVDLQTPRTTRVVYSAHGGLTVL